MGMTRRRRLAWPLLSTFALGCGSGGNTYTLDLGSDEGGVGSFGVGDASGSGALTAHIEQNHVTVTFVTLSCAGPCADVVAVASGGNAPYSFSWDDGSMSASRTVCPTSSTSYSVKVTDTGTTGELARAPESVRVPLKANVIACPDGGTSGAGGCDAGVAALPDGTYSGTYKSAGLGGAQGLGTLSMKVTEGPGSQLSVSLTADVVGVLHTDAALSGAMDCASNEYILRGYGSDNRPWVVTFTYDPASKSLTGDYAAVCAPGALGCSLDSGTPAPPTPHETGFCAPGVPSCVGPVGDSGTYTITWTGP
jgi:hypothetical protein